MLVLLTVLASDSVSQSAEISSEVNGPRQNLYGTVTNFKLRRSAPWNQSRHRTFRILFSTQCEKIRVRSQFTWLAESSSRGRFGRSINTQYCWRTTARSS